MPPYVITFLNSGILFPWFRAQILEPDLPGFTSRLSHKLLTPLPAPGADGDGYGSYSMETL